MQQQQQIKPLEIKLGLSRRKKLPVFYVGSQNYPIWAYKMIQQAIDDLPRGFALRADYFKVWLHERNSLWLDYLPPFPLKGKTVLDVGAGCGESAAFFVKHGAAKVICIEPNPDLLPYLRYNSQFLPLEIYSEGFRPEHISLPHDFMKMDIEGWECDLLLHPELFGRLKPSAIELHNCWILCQFEDKGFRRISCSQQPGTGMGWYMAVNY